MGNPLVEILSGNEVETYVTTRLYRPSSSKVKFIVGNGHDKDFLLSVINIEWDAIVDFLVYSTEAFRERVDLLLGSTKQYVFLTLRVKTEYLRPQLAC